MDTPVAPPSAAPLALLPRRDKGRFGVAGFRRFGRSVDRGWEEKGPLDAVNRLQSAHRRWGICSDWRVIEWVRGGGRHGRRRRRRGEIGKAWRRAGVPDLRRTKRLLCITLINLRGLNGIQGPVYVGTGCVFNRAASYGSEPPIKDKKPGFFSSLCGGRMKTSHSASSKNKRSHKHVDSAVAVFNLEDIEEGLEGSELDTFMSQMSLEKRVGKSINSEDSTVMEHGGVAQSATQESLHVISCGYEDKVIGANEVTKL